MCFTIISFDVWLHIYTNKFYIEFNLPGQEVKFAMPVIPHTRIMRFIMDKQGDDYCHRVKITKQSLEFQ